MLSSEICKGTQGEILTYGERGGYNLSADQTRREDCIDSQSTQPISESGSDLRQAPCERTGGRNKIRQN
jgi:hypothetical protein